MSLPLNVQSSRYNSSAPVIRCHLLVWGTGTLLSGGTSIPLSGGTGTPLSGGTGIPLVTELMQSCPSVGRLVYDVMGAMPLCPNLLYFKSAFLT